MNASREVRLIATTTIRESIVPTFPRKRARVVLSFRGNVRVSS
jgi:hypothetical protein